MHAWVMAEPERARHEKKKQAERRVPPSKPLPPLPTNATSTTPVQILDPSLGTSNRIAPMKPLPPLPTGQQAQGPQLGSARIAPRKPLPPVPEPLVYGPQIEDSAKVRPNSPFADKSTSVISGSKRSSKDSRLESESVLAESSNDAAGKVLHAMTSGQQGLKAFEKVAFAMAGQNGAQLKASYALAAGRPLAADLASAFQKNPGPRAADYLLDCLANDGMPSLRARMWVILGEVDASGSVARGLAKVPVLGSKIGNPGDVRRIDELFTAATQSDRIGAWLDPKINAAIAKLDKKIHARIQLLMNVEDASERLEKADPQDNASAKTALAIARDKQLAQMVRSYTKALPSSALVVTAVGAIAKQTEKLGAKPLGEQKWQNISFKAKAFYDDLVDWKSTASAEDIAEIKKPDSEFNKAMAVVPRNVFLGLTKTERAFIDGLSGSGKTGGTETQIDAVKGSLDRQKEMIDRGGGAGSSLVAKLKSKVANRKWRDLATEIKLLSAEQRKEMLDQYDTDPKRAISKLEADLQTAGFDKESRADLVARFNTEFGNIGDNYAELWQIVDPGKTTKLKTFGAHLAPTKLKKMGDVFSGDARGAKALKVIYQLEDNEYALVRQDRRLMSAIRACSSEKVWIQILDLLGMQHIDDQLTLDSTRETVHQAQLAGEANPKRFAMMLDDAIGEEKILKGVSAGRDKAQLYNVADRARNAAKLRAREDASDPLDFLKACLDELAKMPRGAERVKYLQDRVPQVHAVFTTNTPIPTEDRFDRAKHEGFGIGSLRKVDRQKLEWSFKDLSGKELLDQWSNVDEYIALHKGSKTAETKLAAATQIIASAPAAPSDDERAVLEQANREVGTYSSLVGDIYSQMHTFTVGIKRSRREEFKKIGVAAEDRIKFEAMVSDKLADAMDDDAEVQAIFDEVNLPYDDFMRAKMKGIDALEMQRYLDSTRQWHAFSTKTSELSEATRNVKGGALGTEQKLESARSKGAKGGTTAATIQDIRDKGADTTEDALADREMIEARFRDMQTTFRQRAMVLFKLIVTAIITGIVAGVTYGAGTPLAIAIHLALEAGFNAMQAAYQYYVLGDKSLKRLAANFAIGVLDSTIRILTANLAMGLNASLLHPLAMPPGFDWVSVPLTKGMGKLVHSAVMFAPKHILEQAFHDKALEKVIKEGEASMVDEALAGVGKNSAAFMSKMLVAAVKTNVFAPLAGQETATKEVAPQKSFGQAMNDRMAGGGTPEEQEAMWAKYQKEKQKGAKKDAKKMIIKGAYDKNEKEADKSAHKAHLKEAREKEAKSAEYKRIAAVLMSDDVKLVFRKARGQQLLTLLANAGIASTDVRALADAEKGKIEEQFHMTPGQLDRELRLSAPAEKAIADISAAGAYDTATVETLATAGTIDALALLRLKAHERQHIALALGVDVAQFEGDLRSISARRVVQQRADDHARTEQKKKPLPSAPKSAPTKPSTRPPRPSRPSRPLPSVPGG